MACRRLGLSGDLIIRPHRATGEVRHVADWFEATEAEHRAIRELLQRRRDDDRLDMAPVRDFGTHWPN
ncbi:MAG: hypothetical protein AB7F89_11925 [Pirellulaceae bacterium]